MKRTSERLASPVMTAPFDGLSPAACMSAREPLTDLPSLIAASLTHEIRHPLGSIRNYANGCRRRLDPETADFDRLQQALRRITEEAERVEQIVQHLLPLLVHRSTRRSPTDINGLIEDAAASLTFGESAAAIHCALGADLPRLPIDRVLMRQALVNLLANGLESTRDRPEPARVTVTTRRLDGHAIHIQIDDIGRGGAGLAAHAMFEPFSTSKRRGGGLGLWLSRTIIAAHAGTLEARPRAGDGLSLAVTLPVPAAR
jgi:C4-dicarboxylate-specific signal transduction histidine kinase